MTADLAGRVALVTGAASGLGRATAAAVAAFGSLDAAVNCAVTTGAGGLTAAIVWLCSDAASFVTGHAMSVDGGSVSR